MPVRVKCRCGQELVLRYGEWVYLLLGLVLLCLIVNTVGLLVLYVRLEAVQTHATPPDREDATDEKESPTPMRKAGAGAREMPASSPAERSVKPRVALPRPPDKEPQEAEAQESGQPGVGMESDGDTEKVALAPGREDPPPEALLEILPFAAVEPARAPVATANGVVRQGKTPLAKALVDKKLPVRLLLLEALRDDTPVVVSFLQDPAPVLRQRALEILLRVPSSARNLERPELRGVLENASRLFQLDGLDRRFRQLLPARTLPHQDGSGSAEATAAIAETARRRLERLGLDPLEERLREIETQGLELALVLDISRSMSEPLATLSQELEWFLPACAWAVPRLRVGLILYRDEVVEWRDFSELPESEVLPVLRGAKGEGGGDVPEGVHVAIRAAYSLGRLGWNPESEKHIVLIGDAPPPYAEGRRLLHLVERAFAQGRYRLHCFGVEPHEGRDEVPFFPQLARAGGGRAVTLRRTGIVRELMRCILPKTRNEVLDRLLPSLRTLFER